MPVPIAVRTIMPPAKVTMLGLDFGLSFTGYAVAEIDVASANILRVHDMGLITTERGRRSTGTRRTSDDLRRAKVVADAIRQISDESAVDIVAAEMVTTTPYLRPTFSFGVLTGITAGLGRPTIEVLPYEAKRAVTGDRNAGKKEIVSWALSISRDCQSLWPTSKRPNAFCLQIEGRYVKLTAEHQADALAVIQAAIKSSQFEGAAASIDGIAPAAG